MTPEYRRTLLRTGADEEKFDEAVEAFATASMPVNERALSDLHDHRTTEDVEKAIGNHMTLMLVARVLQLSRQLNALQAAMIAHNIKVGSTGEDGHET